jgi:hypothetical protein
VLLEVLLGGSDHLDTSELEAAVLEAGDDGTDEATLYCMLVVRFCFFGEPLAIISSCVAIDLQATAIQRRMMGEEV